MVAMPSETAASCVVITANLLLDLHIDDCLNGIVKAVIALQKFSLFHIEITIEVGSLVCHLDISLGVARQSISGSVFC